MKLRSRTISVLGAIVTLASAGGLVALYVPSDARAAGETDSAVTVKWAGDNGELQRFQPDRSHMVDNADGSGHWEDFKDLEVTVSQTEGLTDQAVTLTASGMDPSVFEVQSGASNFLQVMQCWGEDPNAVDFAETCQWGGYSVSDVGGTTSTAGDLLGAPAAWTAGRDGTVFRTVGGDVSTPVVPPDGVSGANAGIGAFYVGSTSSERPVIPIGADGTAKDSVVVQSGAAQPYLGCGDPEAAGERCWLVIVPRGVHSGSLADGTPCMEFQSPGAFGEVTFVQKGSPIAPKCTFWDNRVVVPLDFDNPYQSCPPGSAERRVVGSELFAEASSSWQSALCAGDDGATFSLATNSGDLARSQLLDGTVDLAAVSEPLTPDTIGSSDPALLDDADLRYAPLANTSVAIGFVAEGPRNLAGASGTVYTDLKLTPRLVAKLITQSFKSDVPQVAGAWGASIVGDSYEFLGSETIVEDEEWLALGNPALQSNSARAVWLVVGPQGDDAIRLLWEYVLADADAVEFLRGNPDPWGNTVNRYYLPPRHPDAAKGGIDLLSAPLDLFPKEDGSMAPSKAVAEAENRSLQLDSTAYSPYSGSFEVNAARVLRVDRRLTFSWDPNVFVGIGTKGAWSIGAPDLAGSTPGRLALGPVTATAAELYGLNAAQLALPLPDVTDADSVESAREFVAYGDETVAATIAAQRVDRRTGVAVNDPAALPSGAYPLATTLYAAVNLEAEDLADQARADYARLLDHAAGDGNVHTGARGGLPEGYVPLTQDQVDRARALADLLREPRNTDGGDPPDGDDPSGGGADGGAPDGDGPDDDPADTEATVPIPVDDDGPPADGPPSDPVADGTGDGSTTQNAAAATEDTAPLAASVALGGTLIAGLAGMVGAPFLMRRRDLTG